MSIRKRGNKCTVKVYDPKARGRQRWIGTFATEEEARDAERAATTAIAPSARARTVREWSIVWLRDYARSAPATRRTYAYAAKQIVADIGDVVLARIDRPTARRLARQWPTNTARLARTMFGDAARDGLIVSNPFTNLRLETPKGRKDLDALTEAEIRDLADAALPALGEYGTEFRTLILFLGYVGCRPGEACCIRRADVDLERAECTIRFTVDGEGGEKPPKNGKPRVVTIPTPALAALGDVPPRLDSPYLFHSARGRRLSKGSLSYAFRVVRQRWGKRGKLELYELRHACATLLMERGLPPHVVANQLGHTDGGALVQRLYGHPSERVMRDQVRLAFAGWGADGEQSSEKSPGNRRVSHPS
jgi:integrase